MFSKEKVVQRIELIDQITTMIRDLRASEIEELEEIEAKILEDQHDGSTSSEKYES